MKAFIVDVGVCNGCYGCQFACKDEHVGNDWAPIAKPQPDSGQFWMRVEEYICGQVPKVRMHYIPNLCNHCDDAPCLKSCPIEGAMYKRDDGLVIIDTDLCTGCAHLLDSGEWDVPRCVDSCPTKALQFGEESEFAELIAEAEVRRPELGTRPRVYYLNVPKKFIAGTVYDPEAKEVVIDAVCTATPAAGGEAVTATTDAFGDFWLTGLEEGTYALTISADGFAPAACEVSTEKDVSLGDIPLAR